MMKQENVMKRVYDRRRLFMAWQQIKRNAGAAGIDKLTVEEFEKKEDSLLSSIQSQLASGRYRFKPVRRVLIPKPGSYKKRKLGIPTVMDRIVSQSVNSVFEEIFDKDFTDSNFGFRRGRSQHRAIGHMKQSIQEGYGWCVSVDLKSFFDEIPHDLILKLIRRKIRDESLITLIARSLKAGVLIEGKRVKSAKGCPQGSPLSPMLSNIVLNELDQELEERGHKYVRWADDFLVFVKTERAALRVRDSLYRYLERELALPVNREKSEVLPRDKAVFLGFRVFSKRISISMEARRRFRKRVREMTKRNNPYSMYQVVTRLNGYLRGWISYFRAQEFKRPLEELDMFIRSRLRSMQLKKWKKPVKFQRMLIRSGFPVLEARNTWVNMRKWKSTQRTHVKYLLNIDWFRRLGLIRLADFNPTNLEFQLSR